MKVTRSKKALEALSKAVEGFLTDVYWDETGDGSAIALFSPDQVNGLHSALDAAKLVIAGPPCKPWCGQPCPDIGQEHCFHTEANPNRWCRKKCRDAAEKRGELTISPGKRP